MRVKNHMAMWILWFLWFLRVEYSGNPLYKPFCAFLVFVVLVWFLCGRICGFWSRVVFGHLSARPIGLLWSLWFFAEVVVFAFDAYLDARGFVVLWSCLDARGFASMPVVLWSCGLAPMRAVARPPGSCGLLKRFAHCQTSCYVPFRRHWGRPLQNGENDNG